MAMRNGSECVYVADTIPGRCQIRLFGDMTFSIGKDKLTAILRVDERPVGEQQEASGEQQEASDEQQEASGEHHVDEPCVRKTLEAMMQLSLYQVFDLDAECNSSEISEAWRTAARA
jgi:hypothetical protein